MKRLRIYRNLLENPVIKTLCEYLNERTEENEARFYYELYKTRQDISNYLYSLILSDENIYSQMCERGEEIPHEISQAALLDIEILNNISRELKNPDWHWNFDEISKYYRGNGVGILAKHKAFKLQNNGELKPVLNFDDIKMNDLKQYKIQKNQIIENTLGFIKSISHNNILLYGERGCGKSSMVKALVNEYPELKIIQVEKDAMLNLENLLEKLSFKSGKYIIFIDDLTFSENDDNFSTLKAVLEGSLTKQPKNTVIYATSNRKHLIKETFSSRLGDDVQRADTLDEIASLSDRFGLTITFTKPAKDKFLQIVKEIAAERGLNIDDAELFSGAECFALEKSIRSPRVARQYVDYIQARISLNLPI